MTDYTFATVSDTEFDEVVSGKSSMSENWPTRFSKAQVRPGQIGVVCKQAEASGLPDRPLAIVLSDVDGRRLFGRYAHVRSAYSPLSSWCHVLSSEQFQSLDQAERKCYLGGLEAAWVGLSVAEALLLTELPISRLKLAGCLATQSFAVARSVGLWGSKSRDVVIERYSWIQREFRSGDVSSAEMRSTLMPIWETLEIAVNPSKNFKSGGLVLRELVHSLLGASGGERFQSIAGVLNRFGEDEYARLFLEFESILPERRLRVFDQIVAELDGGRASISEDRKQLLFALAGYISTIAAGGNSSLSLAEAVSKRFPAVVAWAYVLGSIGENVLWASAFDGLGRLIARELQRPFRVNDAPVCDFSFDEAIVLVDRQLSNPSVHLRIKQSRIATVSLLAGVNVPISVSDTPPEPKADEAAVHAVSPMTAFPDSLFAAFADALWPHIERKLRSTRRDDGASIPSKGRSKKQGSQAKLPLTK